MGKGIALQFKEAFPDNYQRYRAACKANEVQIGKMFVSELTPQFLSPLRYIINFPTKQHYSHRSKIEYITTGLQDLVQVLQTLEIRSVAIPPLGAGNGGLDWNVVKPLIIKGLSTLDNSVEVLLFEPNTEVLADVGPEPSKEAPKLTEMRTLLLACMLRFEEQFELVSLLAIHKLVYFLQRIGAPMKRPIAFQKDTYGPYAPVLNHVLADLEGHYIRGTNYKTARPQDPIMIIGGKEQAIVDALQQMKQPTLESTEGSYPLFQLIDRLIEGFEDDFHLELLASVDWVIEQQVAPIDDLDAIVSQVHAWNERKARLFDRRAIGIAHQHLLQFKDRLYPGMG
jgi:O-acetyl-ADP-ribose deacetylase (regulator of RNase III)